MLRGKDIFPFDSAIQGKTIEVSPISRTWTTKSRVYCAEGIEWFPQFMKPRMRRGRRIGVEIHFTALEKGHTFQVLYVSSPQDVGERP